MVDDDPFAALGLRASASVEEVKKAYRKLGTRTSYHTGVRIAAHMCHVDRSKGAPS